MVRYIASPVDGARVPSTEMQAPQPLVVIRPSVIQSRTGMRLSISLGDFVFLHWPPLPEFRTLGTRGGVAIPFGKVAAPRC
jgi:hypothetical protein